VASCVQRPPLLGLTGVALLLVVRTRQPARSCQHCHHASGRLHDGAACPPAGVAPACGGSPPAPAGNRAPGLNSRRRRCQSSGRRHRAFSYHPAAAGHCLLCSGRCWKPPGPPPPWRRLCQTLPAAARPPALLLSCWWAQARAVGVLDPLTVRSAALAAIETTSRCRWFVDRWRTGLSVACWG
jgi:hypothetical protein